MTASAPRIAQVAVGIVAGTVVLAMTACGTAPSVDDAVRSYTAAFLSGNGDKAYDLLSARCQSVLSREQLRKVSAAAAVLYGQARMISLTSQVHGDHATVTYRFDQPAIDQENQPWVLESGAWRYDHC